MPAVVHEFTRDQLALALGESRAAADWLLTVAWHLATRLAGTLEALAGRSRRPGRGRADGAGSPGCWTVTRPRAVEAKVLGRAGRRLTPGSLRSARWRGR